MNAAHPEVAVAPGQNPGELLRLAREKRDWSQAEVARKLNLTVSSLNHVETGAFDKLPGHTFARGYIRAYAKLMDLDQAALVDAFDRYTGTHGGGPAHGYPSAYSHSSTYCDSCADGYSRSHGHPCTRPYWGFNPF